MTRNVTITLVENSTTGNPPKIFPAQDIDIKDESDTVITSFDGFTSVGHHPSENSGAAETPRFEGYY